MHVYAQNSDTWLLSALSHFTHLRPWLLPLTIIAFIVTTVAVSRIENS